MDQCNTLGIKSTIKLGIDIDMTLKCKNKPDYNGLDLLSQCNIPYLSPHGPLTRYTILWVSQPLGMPGTFSPPPTSKGTASSRHASRHVCHARAVMHVGIANPRLWGKRSRHSRRMRNPQFYVTGKRPICGGRSP